jgi:hypothetical protein
MLRNQMSALGFLEHELDQVAEEFVGANVELAGDLVR